MSLTYLTVTAHPDDEVLGFGGSSYVLSNKGVQVVNCMLSGNVEARRNRPKLEELAENSRQAQKYIGAAPPVMGPFSNIKFNAVPHLDLVQFIESVIEDIEPDVILTHHPYDLNNDHYHTSKACQAAARLFQRKPLKPLKALYFMEILSSTDWAFPVAGQNFRADTYIEIGEEGLQQKMKALHSYKGVMRDYPHSRSEETVRALAQLRGSECGRILCEGFQTAMHIISP